MLTRHRGKIFPGAYVYIDGYVSKILQILCQEAKRIVPFAFIISDVDVNVKANTPHCEAVIAGIIEASYERID